MHTTLHSYFKRLIEGTINILVSFLGHPVSYNLILNIKVRMHKRVIPGLNLDQVKVDFPCVRKLHL